MRITQIKSIIAMAVIAIILTAGLSSCKKGDAAAASITYQLNVKDQLGISGTATFTQTNSSVTTIDIALTGADNISHPVYLRNNSAIETGSIALTLNPVIGGKSTTVVTALDNASLINYTQLTQFDGYINVYQNTVDTTIIAQGDIGGNLLTSTQVKYTLDTVGALGVSGTALFQKRTNGKTLVTVSLLGTLSGSSYPAGIYLGSVSTVGGGPLEISLNSINGTTGKGYTNIRALNNSTPISYADLLVYDGYLAVSQSALAMNVILCQGNIGTH